MMKRRPKPQKQIEVINDPQSTKTKRREAYAALKDRQMNPVAKKDFDPRTFDPMDDVPDADIRCRKREEPPRRLPDMGMLPKKIDIGQMIGMYESSQDLYLMIAWLSNRVADLEDKVAAYEKEH